MMVKIREMPMPVWEAASDFEVVMGVVLVYVCSRGMFIYPLHHSCLAKP